MSDTKEVILLHGQGGSPEGTMAKFAKHLRDLGYEPIVPTLPHTDSRVSALTATLPWLQEFLADKVNPVLVGLHSGGYAAARLQELRPDMTVIAISAPDLIGFQPVLPACGGRRVAIYSSIKDSALRGMMAKWPSIAECYDLPWLTPHSDLFIGQLSQVIDTIIKGEDVQAKLTEVHPGA